MTNDRSDGREAGFTLMEVMVALVVASILLTIILPAGILASGRSHKAHDRLEAINLAADIMAQRIAMPDSETPQTGKVRHLNWAFQEEVVQSDPRGFFNLMRLEVRVSGADGRLLYTLSARKLRTVPIS